ncbi:hypothetical protein SAY86_005869 [Trapa natans]|uniref:VHS domain-containing protein n=1 Tax=Trapa natans TaxID=22666 RepID=A0AAN7QTX8_TRANT|nr:hypothetical protein SAY86_005869 [Trapa natans]
MLSASSSSVTVRVEKATSDLLINPDWTMNIDIRDYVNTRPGQARDVLKALKKRLPDGTSLCRYLPMDFSFHLEAMVNNCGDYIHFQIVERNIPKEMVKIIKKKTDMIVRDKTLSRLDTWQEAFGGQGGKYPQYYYAYDELRHFGVAFPRHSSPAVPIFTPPIGYPVMGHVREGYGNPSNSSRRLEEVMAVERDILRLHFFLNGVIGCRGFCFCLLSFSNGYIQCYSWIFNRHIIYVLTLIFLSV